MPNTAAAGPRSLAELFLAFNRLALQGFGGVLPIAQRELVERRGWLTKAEFVELLSVGQVLPGPNVVNLALMYGDRCFGRRGALAACAGMLLLPLGIVIAAAMLYQQLASHPMVAGALRGMGAVAAALVLATGVKLAGALGRNPLGLKVGLAYALATAGMVGGLRWPMVAVIAGLGGCAWRMWPGCCTGSIAAEQPEESRKP
ncbi:MAG: chromate transporter [Burkholderiales bacterium]|nr:chromate transporter [Burkholderiales bacterium]